MRVGEAREKKEKGDWGGEESWNRNRERKDALRRGRERERRRRTAESGVGGGHFPAPPTHGPDRKLTPGHCVPLRKTTRGVPKVNS